MPLRLTQRQWRALLQWFVRESLGLRTSHRLAWADVVSDKDTAQIARLFRERKIERSDIQWSGAQRCVGVVYGGRLYRLAPSGGGATARFTASRPKAAFVGQPLGLYLAEYAWRYNQRRLSPAEQLQEAMKLVRRAQVEGMRLTPHSQAPHRHEAADR